MNPHDFFCPVRVGQGTVLDCTCAGVMDFTNIVNTVDEPNFPVKVILFFANGERLLVNNIAESSIRTDGTTVTFEAQDNSSGCPLYTFINVLGYSTTF